MPTEKFSIEQLGQKAKAKGKYADLDDSKAGLSLLEEAPQYWAHVADEYKPDPDKQLSLEEFGKRVREKMPDRFADKDDLTAANEILAENPIYWKSVVEKKKSMGGQDGGQNSGNHWSDATPTPLVKRLPNNPIAKVSDLVPMPGATQDKKVTWDTNPGAAAGVPGGNSAPLARKQEAERAKREESEAYLQSDEFKAHVAKVQGVAEPVIKKYQANLDKGLLPSGRAMDYTEPVRKSFAGLSINNMTPEERKERKDKEYTYQFVDMVMNYDPDLKDLSDEDRYEVRMYLNTRVAENSRDKERAAMIKKVAKASGIDLNDKLQPAILDSLDAKIKEYNQKMSEVNLIVNDAASQLQKELAGEERVIGEGLKLLSTQLQEAVTAGQLSSEAANEQFNAAYKTQLDNLNRRVREQNTSFINTYQRMFDEKSKDLTTEIEKLRVKAEVAGIDFDKETGKINAKDFYDRILSRVQALEGSAYDAKNMRQWAGYSFEEKARLILSSGVGDMIHTAAGSYLANQKYLTGEALRRVAEKMQFDQIPDVGEFSAKSLLDPMWWQTKGLRMLPFTLSLMGPSLAAGVAVRAGAMALGASGAVASTSGAVAATLVSRPLESIMEGGGAYLDVLNNGGSVAEAEKQFAYVSASNMALATSDFLQFLPMFGNAVKGWKRASAVLGGAVLEGGEEVYQEWVARKAGDRDYDLLEFATSPAGAEVFTLGAVNGLAFEMIGTGANNASKAVQERRIKDQTEKLMRQQVASMLVTGEGLVQRKAQLANTLEVQMLSGIINKEDYEAAIQTLDEVVKNFQVTPSTLDDSGRSQFLEAMHELKIINSNLSNATPETEDILKKQKAEKLSQIDKILKGNAEGYFVDNVSYTKDEFTQLVNNPQFVAMANQPGHLVEVRNDEEMLNLVNQRVYGQKLEEQTDPEAKPAEKSTAPTATFTPETNALLDKVQQGKALTIDEGMTVFTELTAEKKRLEEIKGSAQTQTSGEIETATQALDNQIGVITETLKGFGMTDEQIAELLPKEEEAKPVKKKSKVKKPEPIAEKVAKVKEKKAKVKEVEATPEVAPEVIEEAKQELVQAEEEHDAMLEEEDVAPVTNPEKPAPKVETLKQVVKAVKKAFGLSDEQSKFAGTIIDRLATARARRFGTTKESFFEKISVRQKKSYDQAGDGKVLFQLKPLDPNKYDEVTPVDTDITLVESEMRRLTNEAKADPEAVIPVYKTNPQTGLPNFKVYITKKTGKRVVKVESQENPYDLEKSAKELIDPDRNKAIKKLAKKIANDLTKPGKDGVAQIDRPEVKAALGWYSNTAEWIQKNLGGNTEMFAQLLGATSPGTPVKENWRSAMEAMENYSLGMYDDLLKEYDTHIKKYESMSADQLKVQYEKENKGKKLADNKVEGYRIQLINRFDKAPLKRNGTKFNKNSDLVLKALYGNYVQNIQSAKIQDYAGNLSGRTDNAVMDIWASRYTRRLIFQGSKVKRWRIRPMEETGLKVSKNVKGEITGDYAFAQDVFHEVAKLTGHKAADLQALLWYMEKNHWTANDLRTLSGVGEAFDKYWADLQLERYQLGITTARPEEFSQAKQDAAMQEIRKTLRALPGVKAIKVANSIGRYMGENEPTIDVEFTIEAGTNVQDVYDVVNAIKTKYNQDSAFVSRIVDKDHPNARPLFEVNLKNFSEQEATEISNMLVKAGVDGFTFTRNEKGDVIGLRTQFVPEFAGTGDNLEQAEQKWVDGVVQVRDYLIKNDMVAQAKIWAVDTQVFFKEEQDEQNYAESLEQFSTGLSTRQTPRGKDKGGNTSGGTDRQPEGTDQDTATQRIDPEFKNNIRGLLAPFVAQAKEREYPTVVEFATQVIPDEYLARYQRLYNLAASMGMLVNVEQGSVPWGGKASFGQGSINFDPYITQTEENNWDTFVDSLNHEIVHGLLYQGISASNTFTLHSELAEVWKIVQANFDKANDEVKDIIAYIADSYRERRVYDYGNLDEYEDTPSVSVGDLEELVTYAFTEPEFAKFLDSLPSPYARYIEGNKLTIFDTLKAIIRRFFEKLGGRTLLDDIHSTLNKYFDVDWAAKNWMERNQKYEWGHKTSIGQIKDIRQAQIKEAASISEKELYARDGKAFIYHYSGQELTEIDPGKFGRNAITSDKRKYGVSFFYNSPFREMVVDGQPHVVSIEARKIYPINSDPLQIVPTVEAKLIEQGIPATINNILDYSREVLLSLGYQGLYSTSFSSKMQDGKVHDNMVRIEMFTKQPVDDIATQYLRKYHTPAPRKEVIFDQFKSDIVNALYALQNRGLRNALEGHARRLFGKGFYSLTQEEMTREDYLQSLLNEMEPHMAVFKKTIESSLSQMAAIERGELYQKPLESVYDDVQEAVTTGTPLAAIRFTDEKAIITAFEGANITSFFHELGGHFTFEEILMGLNSTDEAIHSRSVKELQIIVDAHNKNNPTKQVKPADVFTNKDAYVSVHEFFANSFVNAMIKFGGQEADTELFGIFKKFAKWVKGLFEGLKGEGLVLTPELEGLFREVLNFKVEETVEDNALQDEEIEEMLLESHTPIGIGKIIIKLLNTPTGQFLKKSPDQVKNLHSRYFTLSLSSDDQVRKLVNQMRYVLDILSGEDNLITPIVRSLVDMRGNSGASDLVRSLSDQIRRKYPENEPFDLRRKDHFDAFADSILKAFLNFNPKPIKAGDSFLYGATGKNWFDLKVPADVYELFEDFRIFAHDAMTLAAEAGITFDDAKMNMLRHMGIPVAKAIKDTVSVPNAVTDEFGRIAVSLSGNSLGVKEGEETYYYEAGEVYPMKEDPRNFLGTAEEMEKLITSGPRHYVRIYSADPVFMDSIPDLAAGIINKLGLEFQTVKAQTGPGKTGVGIYLDIRGSKDGNTKLVDQAVELINKAFVDKISVYRKGDKKGIITLFNMIVQDAGFKALAIDKSLIMFEQPKSAYTIKGQTLFQKKPKLTDDQIRKGNEALTVEMELMKKRIRAQRVNRKALNAFGNGVFDRQFTIKKLLWDSKSPKAAKTVEAINRVRRANSITSHQLQQAYERVLGSMFGGSNYILNRKERALVSRLVNMRRVIELDTTYDATGRTRLTHTMVGLNDEIVVVNKEFAEGWISLLNQKDQQLFESFGVNPNKVNRIIHAADEFSKIMAEQLEQLRKHEVISENAYQKLKQEGQHYSPRLFVSHLEEAIQTGRAAMSKSGIHNLNEGDAGLMLEDIQQFLAMRIRDTQQAIANARLGRAFYSFLQNTVVPWGYIPKYSPDFIERLINHHKAVQEAQAANLSLDNLNARGTIKPLETKYIEPSWETPLEGFRQVTFVLPGGSRMAMHLTNDVADQYEGYRFDMPDWAAKATDILSAMTLTKVLKATATGYNPEFLVRNIPLDILHIMLTTEPYGKSVLLGTAKMMRDILLPKNGRAPIIAQVFARSGYVKDYYRTGGYNQTLTHEGQWDEESTKWDKPNVAWRMFTDFLGYIGQSSELMTRISLRQRYMDMKLKEYAKGGVILSADEREELEYESTEYALGYLDFSQGGAVAKEIDKFIPYFNAATQVTWGSLKALKRNPAIFAAKVTELGVFSVLLGAWNLGLYGDLVKWMHPEEDDDERKKRLADRARFYTEHINPRIKATNWIVMTNMTYMTETGRRYLYFKIPKDASITSLTGWFEGAFMASQTGDMSHLLNKQRVAEVKTLSTLLGDMSFTPPLLKAFHNYNTNQDSYFDEAIWKGKEVQPWAEYQVGRTPNMYVELGQLFATENDKGELEGGLSPMRLNNAINQVIAKNNTFYAMFEKIMNLTVGDNVMPPKTQDQFYESLTKQFFIRRVLASTDYTLDRSEIENFELNANTAIQMVDNEILIFQQKLDDGKLNESDIPQFVEYVASKLMPEELPDYQRKINKTQFERVKRKAIRRAINNESRSKHDYKLYMAMYYDDTARADYLYYLMQHAETPEDRKYFLETATQIDGFVTQPVKDRLLFLEGRFGTTYTSE